MGAIYTLTAKGLFIAHLATHRLNFGQGDFMMVAAFLVMAFLVAGIHPVLAVILVAAILCLMGYLLERIAIRPLDALADRTTPYAWILTTAGVALILQNVVELIWGKSAQYAPPLFSSTRDSVVSVFGVGVFLEELAVIIVAFAVVVGLYWFLFKTRWGQGDLRCRVQPRGGESARRRRAWRDHSRLRHRLAAGWNSRSPDRSARFTAPAYRADLQRSRLSRLRRWAGFPIRSEFSSAESSSGSPNPSRTIGIAPSVTFTRSFSSSSPSRSSRPVCSGS